MGKLNLEEIYPSAPGQGVRVQDSERNDLLTVDETGAEASVPVRAPSASIDGEMEALVVRALTSIRAPRWAGTGEKIIEDENGDPALLIGSHGVAGGGRDLALIAGVDRTGAADSSAAMGALPAGQYQVGPGTYRLEGSVMLSGASLDLARGAVLQVAEGATLTIAAPLRAGRYRIFDTSEGGEVLFAPGAADAACPEWWGPADPGGPAEDWSPAIQAAIAAHTNVSLGARTYAVRQTILGRTGLHLSGSSGALFASHRTMLRGYAAGIGAGGAILRLNALMLDTDTQDISVQGINFRGDDSSEGGTLGIDVAMVKDHVMIRGCSFRDLGRGIGQSAGPDYTAQVYVDDCHFAMCYRAIEAHLTTPLSVVHCDVRECMDWIHAARVLVIGTTFNNSGFTLEHCGVRGQQVTVIGGWAEGGNRQVSCIGYTGGRISVTGMRMGSAYSQNGATKYHLGLGEGAKVSLRGVIGTTNTRRASFGVIADWAAISWEQEACTFPTSSWDSAVAENPATHAGYYREDGDIRGADLSRPARLQFGRFSGVEMARRAIASQPSYVATFPALGNETAWIKVHLSGTNNGTGGSARYYGEYVVHKAFGTTWGVLHVAGTDSWTLSLSDVSEGGWTLTIAENHEGNGNLDLVSFGERSFPCTIV